MSSGHDLSVNHMYASADDMVFDGFIALYDEPRPDWVVDARIDLRVGGTWELVFRPPGAPEFSEHRVFTEVDRPRGLAYTVTIDGEKPAFDTDVAVSIEPHGDGGGCRLTLTQAGFPDEKTRDDFASAWPDVLKMVAEQVESL